MFAFALDRRVTLSDVARMRLGSVRELLLCASATTGPTSRIVAPSVRTGGQRTKVAEMRPARTERAAR